MACPKQVKTRIAAGLLLALLLPFSAARAVSETPSARELLGLVRLNETAQNRDFNGRLQVNGENNIRIPFRLSMRGSTITYQFTNPPESFVLRLLEKSSRLDRVTGSGKTEKITGAKLDDLVRGTDISYEDLSLKFLYWNNAIVEKEREQLKTRMCWIVRAVPSSKDESQYDMVRLWIESTGGLLQGECYAKGKLIRRFGVTSVQKARDIEGHETGGYILKTLSIQRLDETGKDHTPTQLFLEQ